MMYLADGDRYLVFASKAGADTSPAWYFNMRANPRVRVEVGDDVFDADATELEGAERDEKYAEQASGTRASPTISARPRARFRWSPSPARPERLPHSPRVPIRYGVEASAMKVENILTRLR